METNHHCRITIQIISYWYLYSMRQLILRNICFFHHLSSDFVMMAFIFHICLEVFSHQPISLSWTAYGTDYVFQLQLYSNSIVANQLQGFSEKQIPEQFSICKCDILQTQNSEIHCKKIRFYVVLWDIWVKAQTVQSKPRCPLISLVSYEFFILYCPVSEACFQTSLVISKTDQVFYCLISLWTHSNSYLLEKIFCLSSSMCAKAYPSGIPEGNSVW